LDFEKPISTGVQAKNLVGSFLPFSTVSTHSDIMWPSVAALRKDYSITSSATERTAGGTSMPIARAVCKLMTNSNLVDCSTGKSAGFAP
jgi:hypothetical protein